MLSIPSAVSKFMRSIFNSFSVAVAEHLQGNLNLFQLTVSSGSDTVLRRRIASGRLGGKSRNLKAHVLYGKCEAEKGNRDGVRLRMSKAHPQ